MFRTALLFVLVVLLTASSSVAAQASHPLLDEGRELYYAAAFEDALSALDRVEATSVSEAATVEQYRAACLLALGRRGEAERAFERLVTLAPDLRPEDLEMAPWIASTFAAVRARVLPRIDQYHAQDRVAAAPVAASEQPAFHTIEDLSVRRPVPLRERVPDPPVLKGVDFSGTVLLQVDIGTDGFVERVTVMGAIHPLYDAMIREAAKSWRYRPATRDAQPVKFRKALKIEIS